MGPAIEKVVQKCRPKVKALLRTRPYYSTRDMFFQFKTNILPIIEAITPAVYHASKSHLDKLDGILNWFLCHLDVSREEALLVHNLAPLSVRRDFAMLGLLHKCALGLAHPDLVALFPMRDLDEKRHQYSTRLSEKRHAKQFAESEYAPKSDYMRHSVFGLIKIYNVLELFVVRATTVKLFQKRLTKQLKATCDKPRLHLAFSPRQFDT